ncbi:MAG: hypothetical protein U1F77_09405 [Kiritimatiellia bacterium]
MRCVQHPAGAVPGRLPPRRTERSALAARILCAIIAVSAPAAPVQFTSVRASSAAGGDSALRLTIDGVESSARGWSLRPEHSLISAGEGRNLGPDSLKRQEILFIPSAPVEAGRLEFSLFFLCGAADKALAQFSLSATTDPQPSFASDWQRLNIERFTATNTSLEQVSENQLRAVGKPPAAPGAVRDPVYTVTAVRQGGAATAFRLEAIPVGRPGENTCGCRGPNGASSSSPNSASKR